MKILGNLDIEQISSERLIEAVVKLQFTRESQRFKSPATMNRIKSTFRSFFNWAFSSGQCSTNPAIMLHMTPFDSRHTVPICMTEIELLLETITISNDKHSLRDEALFSVYAFAGIRRSEALKLTVRDFDRKAMTLYIANPKGGRSRIQPIPMRLARVLDCHIAKNIMTDDCNPTHPLFYGSNPGSGLTAKQAWIRFDKWKKLSGIRRGLTIHSFRAGYATKLYQKTGDVLLIARAMGHADVKSTERYPGFDSHRHNTTL